MQEQSCGHRNPPRVLVFANRIRTVRFVWEAVREAGLRAAILHGERSQDERNVSALHSIVSAEWLCILKYKGRDQRRLFRLDAKATGIIQACRALLRPFRRH